jgi:hypothetical protein
LRNTGENPDGFFNMFNIARPVDAKALKEALEKVPA